MRPLRALTQTQRQKIAFFLENGRHPVDAHDNDDWSEHLTDSLITNYGIDAPCLRNFVASSPQSGILVGFDYGNVLGWIKMRPPSASDRRALVRQPSRQTLCVSESETKEEILWVARIQDICREGVRLLVMRPFDPGIWLRLEVPGKSPETPVLIQARVIHVVPYPNGSFGLGCAFSRPLTEKELKKLVLDQKP
jgi:hypothetical protein